MPVYRKAVDVLISIDKTVLMPYRGGSGKELYELRNELDNSSFRFLV